MDKELFKSLKSGDKVKFVKLISLHDGELPPIGSTLTKRSSWLDDGEANAFDFEVDGVADFHFFYAEEVELIEQA